MPLKFRTLVLLSLYFVSLPSLVLAASLEKAILLNEHGLTTDAKRELIDVIFQKGSKTDDIAQAYYLLGNIAFGEDRIKVALNSWEYLVDKYPNSEEAGLVRERIAKLSEIVIGNTKETVDNAVARSYLRHADFWSEGKSNGISRFGLEKFLNLTLNFRIIFHAVGEKLYKDVSFSVVVFIARLCEIQGGVCC